MDNEITDRIHNRMNKNRIIFNGSKIGWLSLEQRNFKEHLSSLNINSFVINESKYLDSNIEASQERVNLNEVYEGLRLYDLCIYSICNELMIFKDELIAAFDLYHLTINKWFSFARIIIDDLTSIFQINKFSLVLVINGHSLVDACLLTLAKKYNYPFLCLENTSNNKKVIWDDVTGKVVTFNFAKNYFNVFKNKVSYDKVSEYVTNFKSSIFQNKSQEHVSNVNNTTIPFSKPFVLFLGQVYSDAAQLFAVESPLKNPMDLINTVITTCKEQQIPLVIKLHPKELRGISPVVKKPYDSPTYKRLNSVNNHLLQLDYLNEYNTFKLIEEAAIVITLNSQAGLEACLFNKPVLSYKNSFYSGLGFTYDYEDEKNLKDQLIYLLKAKITTNTNHKEAQKFYYIFFENYCIDKSIDGLLFKICKSGKFGLVTNLRFTFLKIRNQFLVVFKKSVDFVFRAITKFRKWK